MTIYLMGASLTAQVVNADDCYLGFDVGGSSIKWGWMTENSASSASVASIFPPTESASFSTFRWRGRAWNCSEGATFPLLLPAHPRDVLKIIGDCCNRFSHLKGVGLALPCVIKNGLVKTAANISTEWINYPIHIVLEESLGVKLPVHLLNDADAAGLAELSLAENPELSKGVSLMLTLGTGIGSALFIDGKLIPNTELGHLQYGVCEAEQWASARIRIEENLSWQGWGTRLGEVILEYCRLLWPDRVVIGGAVSEKFKEFIPYLTAVVGSQVQLLPASLGNRAGWLGSAFTAASKYLPS